MKERPILMSAPMVRAILDGRKTQTRRVIPDTQSLILPLPEGTRLQCPYGTVGDQLWLRETWNTCGGIPFYKADGKMHADWKWRPSIFMPRSASRITLEVTAVRIERLQDITGNDAAAEGIQTEDTVNAGHRLSDRELITLYRVLWTSINGKKHPWSSNPWVWAITFKRIKP